jgi:Glycosyl transferase family 11
LDGYWQSEKYFIDCSKLIRKDFTFKNELDSYNLKLKSKIDKTNSVSIHIRRGDYVNNLNTNATHGLCSIDYYIKAVNYITERIESPYFFVFSDDIEWAKKNIMLNFPCQFISHNIGSKSYLDMQLMSLCKHNVIANSSFSWWGAWLNSNDNKIVIAPRKWFAVNTDICDLIPSNWISL